MKKQFAMFTCDHKLQEVLLPKNLKCLEDGVFNGCSSLKHIQLPASLEEFTSRESLNDGAFQNSGIVEIEIPEGIKLILAIDKQIKVHEDQFRRFGSACGMDPSGRLKAAAKQTQTEQETIEARFGAI